MIFQERQWSKVGGLGLYLCCWFWWGLCSTCDTIACNREPHHLRDILVFPWQGALSLQYVVLGKVQSLSWIGFGFASFDVKMGKKGKNWTLKPWPSKHPPVGRLHPNPDGEHLSGIRQFRDEGNHHSFWQFWLWHLQLIQQQYMWWNEGETIKKNCTVQVVGSD